MMLTKEELVRVAYIPYVIGNLLWDYVDTIRDLACVLKLGAKRLTNRLREIHTLYEQHRSFSIDAESRRKETEHALQFESECKPELDALCNTIRQLCRRTYPDLLREHQDYLVAVYQARTLMRALLLYVKDCDRIIEDRCGPSMHSILPDHFAAMGAILDAMPGDSPLSEGHDLTRHVNILYQLINNISLRDINVIYKSTAS